MFAIHEAEDDGHPPEPIPPEAKSSSTARTSRRPETWGTEFKEKMPAEIKAKIDEIMVKTERDPDGRTRERILERLRRIRELLWRGRHRG
jgi:hypothetical protein